MKKCDFVNSHDWTWVPEYESRYMVSRTGCVVSFARATPRFLSAQKANSGYLRVQLWKKGICSVRSVHDLVLSAFVSERPQGLVCNHKDGNKLNNIVSNLEWVTRSENVRHSLDTLGNRHGNFSHHVRGEDHHSAKLTEEDVVDIRNLYVPHSFGIRRIAKMYGVRPYTVYLIVNNLSWKETGGGSFTSK